MGHTTAIYEANAEISETECERGTVDGSFNFTTICGGYFWKPTPLKLRNDLRNEKIHLRPLTKVR